MPIDKLRDLTPIRFVSLSYVKIDIFHLKSTMLDKKLSERILNQAREQVEELEHEEYEEQLDLSV